MAVEGAIRCPGGKKAVGGGISAGSVPNVFVLGTAPNPDGSAWISAIQNQSGGTVNVTAYAVCVTAPTSSALVARAERGPVLKTFRKMEIVRNRFR